MPRVKRHDPWMHRIIPSRLASRLTASLTLTSAIVFTVVAIILGVGLSFFSRSMAASDSRYQLSEIRYQLDLHAREIDALIVGFSDWEEFYNQTISPDPEYIATEFDPWLKDRAGATSIVWTGPDGEQISIMGEAADREALLGIARANPDGVRGVMALPSGPAIVAVRPIVGDPPAGPVGTLGVSRAITSEEFAVRGLSYITIDRTGSTADDTDGWNRLDAPPGYLHAFTRVAGDEFLARGTLVGVDRAPALTVQVARPDPWFGQGRGWYIVLVPLGLGIVTVGIGYLLGNALGRSIVGPLNRFVTYIRDQGYLALQGLRTEGELEIDPRLPEDFIDLGRVIKDLMVQLRINQSEIIEAGEQAHAAELAFRSVVEESPEVKILVRGGVVEVANPAAAHFFGLRLGDLLRAQPEGLFSGVSLVDENDRAIDVMQLAQHGKGEPVVARVATSDQPDRWIELSVAFIEPLGEDYVISARNITEERRLEALRKEVLSLVSHDLRSPLTVVRGYLDILDRPLDDERRQTAVENARRAALRMEGLLDDLLGAARAEVVFAPRVMRPVDLSALVESVATSLQLGAEQQVVTHLEPGAIVLGDSMRLEQAVTNLVGNAIKHGPPTGRIDVRVSLSDGRATVSVTDEGAGIPAELRDTLFDRGVRGATDGPPGMGLGLYIVRAVAEAHGGRAYVEEPGPGTTFVLDLPVGEPGTV